MTTPIPSEEAYEAVKTLVNRAMEGPTEAIMDRLERLEQRLPAAAPATTVASTTPNPPPGRSGMLSTAGGGMGSSSSSTSVFPTHFPTPSGNGMIPPGLQLAGLTSYNSPGGALGVGPSLSAGGCWPPARGVGPWAGAGGGNPIVPPGTMTAPLGAAFPAALGEMPLGPLLASARTPAFIGGVVVGHGSPPVPAKLVDKIWRGEFVDLSALLPHRLGAPEPTLSEALQRKVRDDKQITTIEQWVVCFSSLMSVLALQAPQRIRDLLAYMSLIVKAAHDYEGTPWLSYDAHFRCLAATMQLQTWSSPDQAIWSQYFSRASPRGHGVSALSVGPYGGAGSPREEMKLAKPSLPACKEWKKKERSAPYPKQAPICLRWNKEGCRAPDCTYRHVCIDCHGSHKEPNCPTQKGGPRGKSPFRKDAGPNVGGH